MCIVCFFSNQVNLFQLGAGKKHKSQVIASQYRNYSKHSSKLTLSIIRPKQKFSHKQMAKQAPMATLKITQEDHSVHCLKSKLA